MNDALLAIKCANVESLRRILRSGIAPNGDLAGIIRRELAVRGVS